jgi:hypothetical protein
MTLQNGRRVNGAVNRPDPARILAGGGAIKNGSAQFRRFWCMPAFAWTAALRRRQRRPTWSRKFCSNRNLSKNFLLETRLLKKVIIPL